MTIVSAMRNIERHFWRNNSKKDFQAVEQSGGENPQTTSTVKVNRIPKRDSDHELK